MESIFHPSDFSEASEVAFEHALKLALAARCTLRMLHVSADSAHERQDFPHVRDTLERWRVLPEGSPRQAVVELGIDVKKVVKAGGDPVDACLAYLADHPADLIVLAVGQHEGRMRWLHKHVGRPIARSAGRATLFVPHGADGFVSRWDGSVSLRRILVPVARKPRPERALEAVARIIHSLRLPPGTVTLLHAGPAAEAPDAMVPEGTGWTWHRRAEDGEAVDVILKAARSGADLIVMTTDGPDGFLDGLRGTTSERVLRAAHCPVLCLPVGARV